MQNLQIGQRWLVDTDASLGLGIIIECQGRTLTLEFPATGEQRQYARKNAPLTRAVFDIGETVETSSGERYQITRVETINDLLIYFNEVGQPIPETQLAATVQLNHPLKRLLAAQLDKPAWFDVREQLTRAYQQWLRSDVIGLIGARIRLTPHQLYVAQAATAHLPVRVLLADEVGLGKTIEAGLILQRLRLQHHVSRVLVVVPEALTVQWFVELLRCFSIHGTLIDEAMGAAELNDAQVFIAAHSFLESAALAECDAWDVVIVDEAHHFDLAAPGPREHALTALAEHSPHIVLLSATPERLGLQNHFERLQLLDKQKFHDFEQFQSAYAHYRSLATDIAGLLSSANASSDQVLSAEHKQQLKAHFDIDDKLNISASGLAELLMDTYGTGRMVYRNTRQGVSGFPLRKLIRHCFDDEQQKQAWLSDFVKSLKHEKALLITHRKQDVLDLKQWIYRKIGIDCPVFHEDMTLIERDRAAAYFADAEEGAPLLLCSEIGSEGRNFQFCHQLVCWDLPDHPDVLEQRIGRLDRIGQTQDVQIHICTGSADDAIRLEWFADVLNAIEHINPAAGLIHDRWFAQYCAEPESTAAQVKQELKDLLQELEQGRDRLLEINSCRQPEANQWLEKIQTQEQGNNPKELLESIADVLNLHYEQLDEHRYRLIPSDQMLVPMIPGIPLEGCEMTFDRVTASAREDIEFITWDHPLMQGLNEMIGCSDLGVASVGLFPNQSLKPGILFAEVLYTVDIQSPEQKSVQRFLTQSGLRAVVTDNNPKNLQAALPSDKLSWLIEPADKSIRHAVIKDYRQQINQLTEQAEALAQQELGLVIASSVNDLQQRSELEVARLQQLQKQNEAIADNDIQRLRDGFARMQDALENHCQLTVNAIRLLVTYRP
ncbi:MAG: helicase-related protein [Pseudomonadota bacterium]